MTAACSTKPTTDRPWWILEWEARHESGRIKCAFTEKESRRQIREVNLRLFAERMTREDDLAEVKS